MPFASQAFLDKFPKKITNCISLWFTHVWKYIIIFTEHFVELWNIIQIIIQNSAQYTLSILYPEWPHRQGGCLTCCGCTFESSWVHWSMLCTRRSGGTAKDPCTAHEGGGCDQSIGSTVSDAIVRSRLWLTASRSSPLGCFSILQVVDNWPHILW